MATLLQTGAGLALLVGVGHCTLSILALNRGRNPGEVLALDLLVGSGMASLVVLWLSLAGVPRALAWAVGLGALSCLAWCVAALWHHRGRPLGLPAPTKLPQPPRSAAGWAKLALAACLLAMVVAMAHTTLASGLGWDGLAIWGLKAKAVYSEGEVSLSLFHDLSRQWSHLNYPLLLPTVEAWLYWFLGGVNEEQVKVVFVAYQLSLLTLFYIAIRRQHAGWYALVWTLVLASLPALLHNGSTGYADLPLSALVFAASAYLHLWIEEGRLADLSLAGLLAALAPWMKREGLLFWVIALGAVVLCSGPRYSLALRERLRAGLRFALPVVLVAPWLVFAVVLRLPDNDFAVSVGTLLANLPRLPALARLLLEQLISVRSWGVLWQLVALAALWRPRQASAGERYLLAAPAAYLLPLTASYVFSTWGSYTAHVAASLERLVLHVCPTAVLFLALRASRWSPWAYQLSLASDDREAALAREAPSCGIGKHDAVWPLGRRSA